MCKEYKYSKKLTKKAPPRKSAQCNQAISTSADKHACSTSTSMLFVTKSVSSMMGNGTLTIVLEVLVVSRIQMRHLSTTECRWREAKV